MGKRKRKEIIPKPEAQRRKAKPAAKTTTNHRGVRLFWQPTVVEALINFSPYDDTEEAVRKVYTFCNGFVQKLENDYNCTLSGIIESLHNNWSFNRKTATKSQTTNILNKLIKLSCEEIKEISAVLKEIYKIQEKECSEVISNVAERDDISDANFHKLFLELSPLIPVWMGSINETAPREVGAIPAEDNSVIEPGQYVAAFVLPSSVPNPNTNPDSVVDTSDNGDVDSNIEIEPPHEEFGIVGSWILTRVLTNETRSITNKKPTKKGKKKNNSRLYTIVDMDNVSYPHYIVTRKVIIPLPLYRADPRTNPEAIFPIGTVVLALYRNTTCFYPAIVLDTPKTLGDAYTLCFRDLNDKLLFEPIFRVQQRFVIKYVEALSIFTENQRKVLNGI